jgi:lysozyme
MREQLQEHLDGVAKNIKVELSQNQIDAIASFVYNVGTGAFNKSTLLKKLNAEDFDSAANEFLRWNKVDGKVVKGLTRRREAEKELFLT